MAVNTRLDRAFNGSKAMLRGNGYKKYKSTFTVNGYTPHTIWRKLSDGFELFVYALRLCNEHWTFVLEIPRKSLAYPLGVNARLQLEFVTAERFLEEFEQCERVLIRLEKDLSSQLVVINNAKI